MPSTIPRLYRVSTILIGSCLALLPPPLQGQAGSSTNERVRAIGLVGGGIVAGFVVAKVSDWPLKEGGVVAPVILGGAVGFLALSRVRASSPPSGTPDGGRIRLSVRQSWNHGRAVDDIVAAVGQAADVVEDRHHDVVPSAELTYGFGGRVDAGFEVSGVGGQHVVGRTPGSVVVENLTGWMLGPVVGFRGSSARRRRLDYEVRAGIDRYAVSVMNYIDALDPGYPAEQPSRSTEVTRHDLGLKLRAGVNLYVVPDLAVRLGVVRRWAPDLQVPGARLEHPDPALARDLPAHSLSMAATQVTFGLSFHFAPPR